MIKYRMSIIFTFSLLLCFVSIIAIAMLLGRPSNSAVASNFKVVTVTKEPSIDFTTVLVPKNDIKPGTQLGENLFQIEVRPKVSTPATALTSVAQISNAQSRVLLVRGQPILDSMVKNAKSINPVVASIQPGTRAVTIQVNATSSVEGWATAGAFVDVQWVTKTFGPLSVNLLAQNAKILSAERQTENREQNPASGVVPTTVTLLVSDKDAQKISLAATGGELKLHLRGTEDINKPSLAYNLTITDLLGMSSAPQKGTVKILDKNGEIKELVLFNGKPKSKFAS